MPATHLTFAGNAPVFPTSYGRLPPACGNLVVDQALLWCYGVIRVPLAIWNSLRRMAQWIEPMLVAEWVRLTKSYALAKGRIVSADDVMDALRWVDPQRETGFVRDLAVRRIARGGPVTCVWSGRPLTATSFDIDHCLPWSAWPCGDLWNLLPSAQAVNRHEKRECIVTGAALAQAKPLILQWWRDAYLDDNPGVQARFMEEARSTLPLLREGPADVEDLFQAVDFRRLRLRQDTLGAEWAGRTSADHGTR